MCTNALILTILLTGLASPDGLANRSQGAGVGHLRVLRRAESKRVSLLVPPRQACTAHRRTQGITHTHTHPSLMNETPCMLLAQHSKGRRKTHLPITWYAESSRCGPLFVSQAHTANTYEVMTCRYVCAGHMARMMGLRFACWRAAEIAYLRCLLSASKSEGGFTQPIPASWLGGRMIVHP